MCKSFHLFFAVTGLLLPAVIQAQTPPLPLPAATEPTNAAEAAARKAAADKAIDEKYQQWKATLSPEQIKWEETLEANLGAFYLPLYKMEKVRGSISAWDYVKDDPRLPRVLLIGDSVSRGLHPGGARGFGRQGQCPSRPGELRPDRQWLEETRRLAR